MQTLLKTVLIWALSTTIVKIMAALGIGFLVFQGLDSLLSASLGFLSSAVGGISEDLYSILARIGVFKAFSIIASAMTTVASIKSVKTFVGLK